MNQASAFEQFAQLVDRKTKMAIAKPRSHPPLIVCLQIHKQQAAGGPEHTHGFSNRAFGIARMMQ